jgi:protein disulfide-isomerase A1
LNHMPTLFFSPSATDLYSTSSIPLSLQDATTNDVPSDFKVEGYPAIYLYSSGGNLLSFEGARTAEAIVDFIKKNKGSKPGEAAVEDDDDAAETDATAEEATEAESVKDEL